MAAVPDFIAGRPHIAEHELAGTIIDANGTQFTVGDSVFGIIPPQLTLKSRQGALAQYIAVPSTLLISRPQSITPVEAAGLAVAGLTAYQGLESAKLESGQTVFINGGSSGVGSFAIQIAKARGCRVVVSASEKNEGFVRSLGADEVGCGFYLLQSCLTQLSQFIDYTAKPLAQHLASHPPSPKFDAVFDAVGLRDPSLYLLSPSYLAPDGKFITTGSFPHNTSWEELWGAFRQLVEAFLRPWWLGGVHRKYM
jgi:NADPH:quinone reductase-like Zn-dependent oxidoreductase